MKNLIVTGSGGLIGSEVVEHFCKKGWKVFGIENNMRADFFGPKGDTNWNQSRLTEKYANFKHLKTDIRDRKRIGYIIKKVRPFAIIHTAAQPSHDLAASRPFDDFDVNAVGTLNLLEGLRQYSKDTIFSRLEI